MPTNPVNSISILGISLYFPFGFHGKAEWRTWKDPLDVGVYLPLCPGCEMWSLEIHAKDWVFGKEPVHDLARAVWDACEQHARDCLALQEYIASTPIETIPSMQRWAEKVLTHVARSKYTTADPPF